MILSGDVRPEETLYYIGGMILQFLQEVPRDGVIFVEELAREICESRGISSSQFLYGMDWLYLLGALTVRGGEVILCS